MNPHLDKFDQSILYEMNKNGRISVSEIANKLKKSKNFVSKRLRKMRQNRTLLHSAMLVDRSKLGLQTYFLYLRLVDHRKDHQQHIMKHLHSHNNFTLIQNLVGKYQFFVILYAKSTAEVEQNVLELIKKYKGIIIDYRLLLMYGNYSLAHNYLFPEKEPILHNQLLHASVEIPLSDKERKLLKVMWEEPLTSFHQIGQLVRCRSQTAKKMYEKLMKQKVIMCIRPSMGLKSLGYYQKHMRIKLKLRGLGEMKEIEKFLLGKISTKALAYTFGNCDLVCRFVFNTNDEFGEFHEEFFNRFGDIVKDHNYHDYYEEPREEYMLSNPVI